MIFHSPFISTSSSSKTEHAGALHVNRRGLFRPHTSYLGEPLKFGTSAFLWMAILPEVLLVSFAVWEFQQELMLTHWRRFMPALLGTSQNVQNPWPSSNTQPTPSAKIPTFHGLLLRRKICICHPRGRKPQKPQGKKWISGGSRDWWTSCSYG